MRKFAILTLIFILGLFWPIPPRVASAFPVDPLPEDNLISNPWFRSTRNPNAASLDGWTDAAGPDTYWLEDQSSISPSPDMVVSGVCGNQPAYCGTAARYHPNPGFRFTKARGIPGVDAYLYQVVSANSSHRKLKFFTHWTNHIIDIAEVTIYGSDSSNGPWSRAWVPFTLKQDVLTKPPPGNKSALWFHTDFLETTISRGYNYYKVEMHARFSEPDGVGIKFTGLYFATEFTDEPGQSGVPTAPPIINPTITAADQDTASRNRATDRSATPEPTKTTTLIPFSSNKPATLPASTPTLSYPITQTPTPEEIFTPDNSPNKESADQIQSGFLTQNIGFLTIIGLITLGLIVMTILILRARWKMD